MIRLRHAVAAAALATCGIGCATFCDECDDFPIPGRFASLPGSYTGPPLTGDASRAETRNYVPRPSPTATSESGTTPAPAAPSSDDGPATGSGTSGEAAPPPPAQPSAPPFTPGGGESSLPQLP